MSYIYESKIQNELRKATGTHKRVRDTELFFKERLMHSAYTLTEKEWDRLSPTAQKWVVDAIKNYNDGKPLPGYPDEAELKAKRSAASSKSAKHREENLRRGKRGAGDRVKEIMLDHGIKTTPKEIHRILQQEGYKFSKWSIPVVRAEFRRALQMLWERGELLNKPKNLYEDDK